MATAHQLPHHHRRQVAIRPQMVQCQRRIVRATRLHLRLRRTICRRLIRAGGEVKGMMVKSGYLFLRAILVVYNIVDD